MIYLDNNSTTALDPIALDAMLPLLREHFANAGSSSHSAGRAVAEFVDKSIAGLASMLAASADEIVITSGATESNNLALFGACLHPRQTRRRIVSLQTEHKALLDPLARLEQMGFEIVRLPVADNSSAIPGRVDLQQLAESIDEKTALVSVMLANNEIGIIQPLAEIAQLCRKNDCLLHSDATQAVGRMPVNVDELDVDLLSFSAHKFYGPKGVGGLYVRRKNRRVRLQPQIVGGGQQNNFRSGTLNSPAIVGMHAALQACLANLANDRCRIAMLRNQLFRLLVQADASIGLNGPSWLEPTKDQDGSPNRLVGNLNACFYPIEGQSLMLAAPELAVSSGSACTSANPSPSHVLQAIGLSEEQARSSLRFGIGRFTTEQEIETAAAWIADAMHNLRKLLA